MTDPISAAMAHKIGMALLKKGLEKIMPQLLGSATGATAKKLETWKATKAIKSASDHLYDIRLVKTIWQIDKPIDIMEFYYPSKLRLAPGKACTVTPCHSARSARERRAQE